MPDINQQGTVKWFNTAKGYGFIQPAGGGSDVFLHITAVQQSGMDAAEIEKIAVLFDTESGRGDKVQACNLRVA